MEKDILMKFLQEVDKDFTPCLSQKTDLPSFCDKILDNARLFASYSGPDKLNGLVVMYANDFIRKYAYIPLLAVSPDCRKQGIARRLMDAALGYVRSLGSEKIRVVGIHTGNPVAFRSYERLGFRLVDESNNREYLELSL